MAEDAALGPVLDGSAWEEFCEHLKRAGRSVIEAAPEDAFDRAEGLRYLGRIAGYGLLSFIEQSDPAAPVIRGLPKMGGDNPDYLYGSSVLSGEYEYRVTGNVGDARYYGLGTYSGGVGTPEGLVCTGYLAADQIETDARGDFEVWVSCRKQPGNWLPMEPDTSELMIRQTLVDRRRDRPARFEIARSDGGGPVAPLDPAAYARQLAAAGRYVEHGIAQFLEWTRTFAREANEIRVIPERLQVAAQGDARTHYYAGYYEIAPEQALLIDFAPPACDYWNLQLCNHWLESLDYWHHQVHVNDHHAVPRPGGGVRLVAAHRDPGVPNWLDTAGHRRGCIIMRQVGTDAPADPVCRVVPHSEVSA